MDGFWHTLFRFNARYLALGAAVVLMLAMSAWLVALLPRGGAPGAGGVAPGAVAGGAGDAAVPLPGPTTGDAEAPSPFESRHLSELVALSDEGLLKWDTPSSPSREPPPEAAPPPAPVEEPKPEPRTVNVRYLGMMTRTDGTTVAFMEKEGDAEPTACAAGAPLIEGVNISDIQRGHVEVEAAGKKVSLVRGGFQTVEY